MSAPVSTLAFEPSSYRDPDARVFRRNGSIFRCLSARALEDWRRLATTTFFGQLTSDGTIVQTEEVDRASIPELDNRWAAVLRHAPIPFISYPYEWSFAMLKRAALLQLDVTLAALSEDMTLKDATPYNIQWVGARATFIDIGSFTRYVPGEPWAGYRQFCELFLFPLLLMAHKNVPFHPLLRGSLEGISAGDCRALMSSRDTIRPGVLAHVFLQSRLQAQFADSNRDVRGDLRAAGFGTTLITRNIERLHRLIERLEWKTGGSTWSEYGSEHSYDETDRRQKEAFVRGVSATRRWALVWDLGCNVGVYSRIASDYADCVVALDADHLVIDRLYRGLSAERQETVLPLVGDIADPAPGLGWRGKERRPLVDRGTPELILSLALIHHLVIGRNIPLADLIAWLAEFGADLVIEFVGPTDPMVQRLMRNRDGQAVDYSQESFEAALDRCFDRVSHLALASGTRTLYHLRAKTRN
jgi:hypothetical protein